MRVIVAGSRGFTDYPFLSHKLGAYFYGTDGYERGPKDITIVSGGARGADMLGERFAKANGFKIKRWKALWDEHGKSAGYRRNLQMAEDATHLIAFWDGKSRGTKHMIDIAKDKGLVVTVFEV